MAKKRPGSKKSNTLGSTGGGGRVSGSGSKRKTSKVKRFKSTLPSKAAAKLQKQVAKERKAPANMTKAEADRAKKAHASFMRGFPKSSKNSQFGKLPPSQRGSTKTSKATKKAIKFEKFKDSMGKARKKVQAKETTRRRKK